MIDLSIFYGFHDSCATFYDVESNQVLMHLEAERFLKQKHVRLKTGPEMFEFVQMGLKHLGLKRHDINNLLLGPLCEPTQWNDTLHLNMVKPVQTIDHHHGHIGVISDHNFDNCLVLVADGVDENGKSTALYFYDGTSYKLLEDASETAANGSIYGSMTQLIVDPDLHKASQSLTGTFMGLSAHGNYKSDIADKMLEYYEMFINTRKDYSLPRLQAMFNISTDYTDFSHQQERLDFCHTGQIVWTEQILNLIRKHKHLSDNICVSGGCALNVILNTKLTEIFDEVHTSPVPGDSGQSLGIMKHVHPEMDLSYPYLGADYGNDVDYIPDGVVDDLVDGKFVCWYQGRSEIGPRSLGHRSYLALPDTIEKRDKMNKMKGREWFRPVAPIIPRERLTDYFETEVPSPYMSFAPQATELTRQNAPAVVHADGSSRLQTLEQHDNPVLHEILTQVGDRTGTPMLMNTSFNRAGKTVVETEQDAKQSFKYSKFDVLYVNGERVTHDSL